MNDLTSTVVAGSALGPYRKSIAAILGALGVALFAALADQRVSTAEAFVIAIAGISAVLVYLIPNVPGTAGATLKWAVSTVLAIVQAIALYRDGGLTPSEIVLVTIAGLTAAGVYIVPNDDVIPGEVLASRRL
jgi:hypothetical protein